MPAVTVVERDYPNLYKRFTSLGPLIDKVGNGGKGIAWETEREVEASSALNGAVREEGRPRAWRRSRPPSTPAKSFSCWRRKPTARSP